MTNERLSVLITGATGNLGQKIRRHLAAASACELRLLCLNPSNDPAVATVDLSQPEDVWGHFFEGVDVVLHFAGDSSPSADWPSVQRNNIDATLNVFHAAIRHNVRRVVFASSTWAMAGYRFGTERLTADLPARPVGFYGLSKLICERIGESFARSHELSVICLRIGFRPVADDQNVLMSYSRWEQEMWISDRDFVQLVEKAVVARDIGFAIVNGESNNPGMRWDLGETRRLLGYVPEDGRTVMLTPRAKAREVIARLASGVSALRSTALRGLILFVSSVLA
jgi:NAD+ dependent glucose-6-phosphate dehydrogenase